MEHLRVDENARLDAWRREMTGHVVDELGTQRAMRVSEDLGTFDAIFDRLLAEDEGTTSST